VKGNAVVGDEAASRDGLVSLDFLLRALGSFYLGRVHLVYVALAVMDGTVDMALSGVRPQVVLILLDLLHRLNGDTRR